VVRVPPKLMAQSRASARTRGESDPIDALAVARAVLREPDLPGASHDERSRELKLLVDQREDVVGERTWMINRFCWHVHRIDPTIDPRPKSLRTANVREQLAVWLAPLSGIDAEIARAVLADIDRVTPVIDELEQRISQLVDKLAPALLAMPGCGPLTAAKAVPDGAVLFGHGRGESGPGGELAGRAEPGHVADLGRDHRRGQRADPG
jgi:transposase